MAEPHAMAESAPLILPGESLKKYREAPPSVKTPAAVEPEGPGADEAEPMEEFDEPIHYPAENALPDAPVHGMLEGVVDAVSPEVLPAIPEPLAEVAPPPLPQEYVAAHAVTQQEEEDAEEAAEENEGGPAIAPGLDDEEDRDIQAMILGDIEGLDAPDQSEEGGEGGEETPVAETGGEGGATSESGSASVRERSGRYPHRASRRRRRRGGPGGPEGRVSEGRGPEGRGPAAQSPEGSRPEQSRPEQSGAESVRPEYARPQQQVVARPTQGMPSITDLLKEGQEIIVQIAKEPLGQKGARITSHIALPGRYVVYMPTLEHMGVSRKIAQRRRAPAAEAHPARQAARSGGRLHHAHGRRRPQRRRDRRRHAVPLQPVAGHSHTGRKEARADAAASRSGHRAADPARSAGGQFQGHLDRQRRALRKRAAIRRALPAGAGSAR